MNDPRWQLEDLWLQLSSLWPGVSIECLPEIDSTNTELMRRARSGQAHPVLLVAQHQTAGRGRLGREWVTPAHSALTFSLGLPLNPPRWEGLSLAVGMVLADAMDPQGQMGLGLKWPNDLWHWPRPDAPAKLGGILIETLQVPGHTTGRYAIVGVGINVLTPQGMVGGIAARGLEHWGSPPHPGELLTLVAPPLLSMLAAFHLHGPQAWLQDFARRDVLLNQPVQTSQGLQGLARGIDPSGALLLDTAQGRVQVNSSEVSVRPLEAPT
jgi:BirA family transcriptional regulator, biotin operon repressor / biotin---[acetyl-CoA-carboxylase] ligase